MATRGVVYVHSAPPALCPHVEWAVGGVLDMRVTLDWTPQPAAPGVVRAELSWQAEAGMWFRMPGGYVIGPTRDGRPRFDANPNTATRAFGMIQRGLPAPRNVVNSDSILQGVSPSNDKKGSSQRAASTVSMVR